MHQRFNPFFTTLLFTVPNAAAPAVNCDLRRYLPISAVSIVDICFYFTHCLCYVSDRIRINYELGPTRDGA